MSAPVDQAFNDPLCFVQQPSSSEESRERPRWQMDMLKAMSTPDALAAEDEDSLDSCPPLCASDDEGQARNARASRPCPHNQWLKYGKKQGKIVLRCTEPSCRKQWKIKPHVHVKCEDFYKGGCSKGADCPHPHIYARQGHLRTVTTPIEGLARRTDWPPRPDAVTSFSCASSTPPSNQSTPSSLNQFQMLGGSGEVHEALKPVIPPSRRPPTQRTSAGVAKAQVAQPHQQHDAVPVMAVVAPESAYNIRASPHAQTQCVARAAPIAQALPMPLPFGGQPSSPAAPVSMTPSPPGPMPPAPSMSPTLNAPASWSPTPVVAVVVPMTAVVALQAPRPAALR